MEDDDTMTGFQTRWNTTAALSEAVKGGLQAGRVLHTTPKPYAQIACTQGPRTNEWNTGNGYTDYRKVTITVVGSKAEVVTAVGAVRAAYDWQPKGAEPQLAIPNASVKRVMPLAGSPRLEEDPTEREGESLWRGIVEYEVMSNRTKV